MTENHLITECLTLAHASVPDKLVAVSGEQEYRFTDLYEQSQAIAMFLQNTGLRPGERVAIYMDNRWPVLPSIFGILYAGGVFLIIHPQTKPAKLAQILTDAGAAVLITQSSLMNNVESSGDLSGSLRYVLCDGECQAEIVNVTVVPLKEAIGFNSGESELRNPLKENDLAALLYTSGSTGEPKGVMMSHGNISFTVGSLVEYLGVNKDDRMICILPFSFGYGLYHIFMAVQAHATLILSQSFAYPGAVFNDIREHSVTLFPAVPTMYSAILAIHEKTPLSLPSVRKVTNAAAALPPQYLGGMGEVFPNAEIFLMYGLTECTRVCFLDPNKATQNPTSVGKPIPGTSVMVLDSDRQPVPSGEIGTLYVRGRHIMQGYWNKPEETEKMLISDLVPGEKVLCAQDQFVQDKEGQLYFKGRSDGILKIRGEKVSIVEVENALHSCPGIKEAAVIGVADAAEGQVLKAFVVIDNESVMDSRSILRYCRTQLEPHMVPREIVTMEALPRTTSGKISRKELF